MVIQQYIFRLYNNTVCSVGIVHWLKCATLTFKSLWMMLCVCMCSTAWNNWNITCLKKKTQVSSSFNAGLNFSVTSFFFLIV